MALTFDKSMLETDEGLLNDIIIQFETIEDTFEKAIARYDYPFADGADLEDMGQKAHLIRFRCWFWDDAENQSYDTHTLVLDSLVTRDLLDFVHPKYGLLKGKVESVAVNHNEAVRTAVLDIMFIEQMRGALTVAPAQSVLSATEEAYQTGQTQQTATLATDIKSSIPAADAGAASKTLVAATGLLTQMQGYANSTRAFVGEVEKYISTAEAYVNQVVSPVNSLQATMTYDLNLPGRILGSISGAVEKVARLNDSLLNYPSQYISKLSDAFDTLESSLVLLGAKSTGQAPTVMIKHYQLACAQRLALEAAAIYAADYTAANDTTGASEVQVMNINELEATLAIVRTRLAAAVAIAREMDSLKTMSAALLTQVNAVRLEREKMIKVVLDNPMPLHLVCLKYGLPYQDAERLNRVNSIPNPNFTAGEVAVYAR